VAGRPALGDHPSNPLQSPAVVSHPLSLGLSCSPGGRSGCS
jgi:hypothetical protein